MSIRLLSLLLIALAVACTTIPPEEQASVKPSDGIEANSPLVEVKLRTRVNNIKYQKGTKLISNLERLAAYGEVAVPFVVEGTKSEDAMTRMGCAYVLGRVGNRNAIPHLEALLGDKVAFVRYEAASQLGSLGSKSGYAVLVSGLEDERIQYRYKCYEALHELTGQEFGYSHNAAPERRKVSVASWQSWLDRVQSEEY